MTRHLIVADEYDENSSRVYAGFDPRKFSSSPQQQHNELYESGDSAE
jgi:hypothetical protein